MSVVVMVVAVGVIVEHVIVGGRLVGIVSVVCGSAVFDSMGGACLCLVDGCVAPAVVVALAVCGLGQIAERVGELARALLEAEVGEGVPLAIDSEVSLLDESIEIADALEGVHPEKALDHWRIDDVAEAFAAQPVHHLEDLAAPIQHLERR